MLPSRFASFGSTISTISEVEALTGFPGSGVPGEIAVTVPPDALAGIFALPFVTLGGLGHSLRLIRAPSEISIQNVRAWLARSSPL